VAKLKPPGLPRASCHELGQVLRWHRRIHEQAHRDAGGVDYRREVLERVVGQLAVDVAVDGVAHVHQQQRVAVGRRPRDHGSADAAGAPGLVLDQRWLSPALLQTAGDVAGQHVGAAAGRDRCDEADGLARKVGSCVGAGRVRPQRDQQRGESEFRAYGSWLLL
jgi:hypothetical protein